MTRATLDYLLRLALADRDKHARRVLADEDNGGSNTALDDAWGEAAAAVKELLAARGKSDEVETALRRAEVLVPLLTVRQVIEAGGGAIAAAGLNPWCINEGRATGDERIGQQWWLTAAIKDMKGGGDIE